jgi:superfamily I DNA/RNA helicase
MLTKTENKPTDEQLACIDAAVEGGQNLMINSYAGTGKTTTLQLIEGAIPEEDILYLAFNKSIVKEAKEKFRDTTEVKTINGLGHGVWARTIAGKVTVGLSKSGDILREVMNESNLSSKDKGEIYNSYWEIIRAVGYAKSIGYIPERWKGNKGLIDRSGFHAQLEEDISEAVGDIIDAILLRSILASYKGWIDFDDQIYMPGLFGGSFPRYSRVLIDEAQDLNPVNHEMLRKLCKGWSCFVGDPCQSIYGFRGAVNSGMARLKEQFKCQEKTISYSFRCPRAIVEAARWRVPGFNWVKEGGLVSNLETLHSDDILTAPAIICRNNAPLFNVAFKLLGCGRSVNIAGSDIGPKILAIMKKLGPEDTPRDRVLGLIEAWREEKLAKVKVGGNVHDTADAMRVFASYGEDLSKAMAHVKWLFEQQGTIQLSTGHKAKGQEWNTVYHLDPRLIGSDEQELNLRYVITTRSADQLYMINSEAITWGR